MIYEEYIDRYLRNEMDEKEKSFFEKRLSEDHELQGMYELTKDIAKAVTETEVLQLRRQLDVLHDEIYKPAKSKAFTISQVLKVAAVFAGIVFISSLLLLNKKTDCTNIYNKYFEPYESTVRIRSANSNGNLVFTAMNYYDNGNYKEAARLFEQVLLIDSTRMAINLYSGISNMEIKEYEKADRSFNNIIKSNNNPYIEQAEWYLGFCYLMTGEREKALKQFETIADSKSYYNNKALKITKEIKKMNN